LDKILTSEIGKFEKLFLEHLHKQHPYIIESIHKELSLTKDTDEKLGKILESFMTSGLFVLKSGN